MRIRGCYIFTINAQILAIKHVHSSDQRVTKLSRWLVRRKMTNRYFLLKRLILGLLRAVLWLEIFKHCSFLNYLSKRLHYVLAGIVFSSLILKRSSPLVPFTKTHKYPIFQNKITEFIRQLLLPKSLHEDVLSLSFSSDLSVACKCFHYYYQINIMNVWSVNVILILIVGPILIQFPDQIK